jgi:predicted DNA-binding transcriptional regulator YafY
MSSDLERIYKIDQLLRQRYPPTLQVMMQKLEVSRATVNRDLGFMRDRLNAPIVFDRHTGGYRYDDQGFALPGVWFTQSELSAMLVLHQVLLESPLGPYAKELSAKIRALLQAGSAGESERLSARIRVASPGLRRCNPAHFEVICSATVLRRQLKLRYFTRSRKARTERIVSPQQIICYRANWYFDAWCHRSEGVRRFAVDAIESVSMLESAAVEAAAGDLSGYGIFVGAGEQTARLRFRDPSARWVANELWHPRQTLRALEDGTVELEVPYSHPQEILMDILRHGASVEVLAPRSLRAEVAAAHREAALQYELPRKAAGLELRKAGSA